MFILRKMFMIDYCPHLSEKLNESQSIPVYIKVLYVT